jgi:hypothetical protein
MNQSISSWSDSYYGIGPAAYAFISYAHWLEPSYAQYIKPSEQNAQFISESKNVTNIVTNNNVINNFGPPVQTVATKTNQNIQQVKLSLSPATDPHARYGQTLQGNQLNVVAPSATLKPQASHGPPVQSRIANPQVEKGWQGLKPEEAEKLKKTVAEQNPPPGNLPKPTPFLHPQTGNQAQVAGAPTPGVGQKTPPNLVKPGAGFPNANTPPGASPKATTPGKSLVPPNLLATKPSGAPPSATPHTATKPVQEGKPETTTTPTPHNGPANLTTPKPTSTPNQPPNLEAAKPHPRSKKRREKFPRQSQLPHRRPIVSLWKFPDQLPRGRCPRCRSKKLKRRHRPSVLRFLRFCILLPPSPRHRSPLKPNNRGNRRAGNGMSPAKLPDSDAMNESFVSNPPATQSETPRMALS